MTYDRHIADSMKSLLCSMPTAIFLVVTMTISTHAAEEGSVEDIYVVRSLRLSRVEATSFCDEAKTGIPRLDREDRYNFQSLSVDTASGIVTDANVATVGWLHACFGPTSEPSRSAFYAEGVLNGTSFTGIGDCLMVKKDFPEEGLRLFRCFLDLSALPQPYVAGHLTTNSVTSKKMVGMESDPPGYVQPSIATLRLWKKRSGN